MGDTLNSFHSRLNAVERRRMRRGRRFPRHDHAVGKAPVVEGDCKIMMESRNAVKRTLVCGKMFKTKMVTFHSRSLKARGGEIHRYTRGNTTNDLRFHGNSDPVEFLGHFNIEMDVYQVPDLARCRLLAATFREGAQQWFQKLGPGVITSWEQMETLFLTQFQAAVKYTPPVTTLANVKQMEGESLTSYFKRFNAKSTLVRGATDETLKILLIVGLRVGTDLWKHQQGKDPVSLADVLAQAESFKAIEQSLAETKKNDNAHNSKGRAKRRDRSLSPDYRRNARSPNRVNTVNTRREWSPPSNYERRSRDKKKYCDYHESTGHDTHECHHLKDEIEELIKAGYLGEWIDKVK
ncbi:uncharacterized protein LOC141673771 [Apium graveolens]|uniref:uncharacterized protein LOC141673771 n=1 Tax=Apium graveolens TaxID=4045 RepID=UPI003D7B797C